MPYDARMTHAASGSPPAITIIVGNRHHKVPGEYVGRGTPLGNMNPPGPDLTRDASLDLYDAWIDGEIAKGDRSPAYRELVRLAALARVRGTLTVLCSCAPRRCHADAVRDRLCDLVGIPRPPAPPPPPPPAQLPLF